jgi:hypothetical protein
MGPVKMRICDRDLDNVEELVSATLRKNKTPAAGATGVFAKKPGSQA